MSSITITVSLHTGENGEESVTHSVVLDGKPVEAAVVVLVEGEGLAATVPSGLRSLAQRAALGARAGRYQVDTFATVLAVMEQAVVEMASTPQETAQEEIQATE